MTASPATSVAAALRHIERCRKKNGVGPKHPKTFPGVRVEGTDDAGVVSITVATEGHAWRMRVFAQANGLRVRVRVDAGALERDDE